MNGLQFLILILLQLCIIPEQPLQAVPRLFPDTADLISWINQSGGKFNVQIIESYRGWSLQSQNHSHSLVTKNDILIQIPKKLCISSNPDKMLIPLSKNSQEFMKSISNKQWRARLAIAILSERVKINSSFNPYLRNLPFEFWGMPVFFTAEEFRAMQDINVLQNTRERCKFLREFTESVLKPLQSTPQDPFSGNTADVNAFGWGFAAASSRAIRYLTTLPQPSDEERDLPDTSSLRPVMEPFLIPGVDLVEHSFQPNSYLSEEGDHYVLRSLRDIDPSDEITMNYGPLSNDELFMDYGFTVESNPYDTIQLICDDVVVNTARGIVGQSRYLSMNQFNDEDLVVVPDASSTNHTSESYTMSQQIHSKYTGQSPEDSRYDTLRINGNGFDFVPSSAQMWQSMWFQAMGMSKVSNPFRMLFQSDSGPLRIGLDQIDGKLWGLLRVLYSSSEEELWRNGYTPSSLQERGSMLSVERESQVVRTMIGLVGLCLQSYGSHLNEDLNHVIASGDRTATSLRNDLWKAWFNQDFDIIPGSWRVNKVYSSAVKESTLRLLRKLLSGQLSGLGSSPSPVKNRSMDGVLAGFNLDSRLDSSSMTDGTSGMVPSVVLKKMLERSGVEYKPSDGVPSRQSSTEDAMKPSDRVVETKSETIEEEVLFGLINPSSSTSVVNRDLTNTAKMLDEIFEKSSLSFNMKAIYKYRIHRKIMLSQLLLQLGDLYKRLQERDPQHIPPLSAVLGLEETNGSHASSMSAVSRMMELFNTENEEKSSSVWSLASKVSAKWDNLNASL